MHIAFLAALSVAVVPPPELIDMDRIENRPLDATVLESRVEDGIVIEDVEFTSIDDPEGNPIRTFGILAYPESGTNLPAVLWCQGGMADAGVHFPRELAKKGYLSISISLPKKEWNAHAPFDAGNPHNANYIRLAATHMRAITYLVSRPESDGNRIGVGGSSYGGMFSTLVSGLDPRVLAGMSFFSGGNHHLGTNLPQFTGLKDLAAVEVFKRTGDGAPYHRNRAIPFLWGVAANDNWFYFPAVTRTATEAKSEDVRMAIYPHWTHGFPEVMDNQLLDWFDTQLLKTRAPYNKPSELRVENRGGKLVGEWTWTADNAVKSARLIVCYGRILPWHGWRHRLHWPFPAEIDGETARAEIPVPEPGLQCLVYGNIIDENDVLVSTDPVTISPAELGVAGVTGKPTLNGYPWGDFEGDVEVIYTRHGYKYGVFDTEVRHGGEKSLRIDPAEDRKAFQLKLHQVYEHSHTLKVWAKADRKTSITLTVKALLPSNWSRPAVQAILATMPEAAKLPAGAKAPVFSLDASLGTDWKQLELACPFTDVPVEGYNLVVDPPEDTEATVWLDDIRFEPEWEK